MTTDEQHVLDIQGDIEKFNLLDKALCYAAADLIRKAIETHGATVAVAVCLVEAEMKRDIRVAHKK